MTVTISSWVIPLAISVLFLALALRPYKQMNDYDIGQVFRLFWSVPILLTWLIYFAFMYFHCRT